MLGKWKKINSKVVFSAPRFKIREDVVIRPDGSKGKYFYRDTKPSVGIIPFDGKKIYLVNQYRYPIKKRLWEIPLGKAESSDFLAQAKKELAEETGLRAKQWKALSVFYPVPGSGNSQGRVFVAQQLTQGKTNREPGESDMHTKSFTIEEINKMIAKNQIIDGWTLAALHIFKLKFKL